VAREITSGGKKEKKKKKKGGEGEGTQPRVGAKRVFLLFADTIKLVGLGPPGEKRASEGERTTKHFPRNEVHPPANTHKKKTPERKKTSRGKTHKVFWEYQGNVTSKCMKEGKNVGLKPVQGEK